MKWPAIFLVAAVLPFFLEKRTPADPYLYHRRRSGRRQYLRHRAGFTWFLWFCTTEGLSRFDGYRFTTYGADEGLPHRIIESLIETRSGAHWIGTPLGLSRITTAGAGPRFKNYRLAPEAAANNIGTLLELHSGTLLAATGGGLFEWTDPSAFRRRDLHGIDPQQITDMTEDRAGNLWIATITGLHRFRILWNRTNL